MSDTSQEPAAAAALWANHADALSDKGHPDHELRTAELTRAYEAASGVANTARDVEIEIGRFREKHAAALHDNGHPEHKQRLGELSAMYGRKSGAGNDGGVSKAGEATNQTSELDVLKPARDPADYDFKNLSLPSDWQFDEGSDLERWSRDFLYAGEVSPAEGRALLMEYVNYSDMDVHRSHALWYETENALRQKYGADVGQVATAALRVVNEFPEMAVVLQSSGVINSPRVIDHLIRVAQKRGYMPERKTDA